MSTDTDALKTIHQPIGRDAFYAAIQNPYVVTAATPLITDDVRNGSIAEKISSVKRAGFDSIIMDYHRFRQWRDSWIHRSRACQKEYRAYKK